MAKDSSRFKIREITMHEVYDSEHPDEVVRYRGDLKTAREIQKAMTQTVKEQEDAADRIQADAQAAHRRELLAEDHGKSNDAT